MRRAIIYTAAIAVLVSPLFQKQKPRMAQITLGISSGIGNPDRTGKLYETFGAENVGGIYVKRIKRK